MKEFSIIVAMDQGRGIGKDGGLPWHLSSDLKHFKEVTVGFDDNKKNVVVMGRRTWESLPERFRPLPGRLNVVLSRQNTLALPEGCLAFSSMESALNFLDARADIARVFVIGGAHIYEQALKFPQCRTLYVTEINDMFDCDVFFPEIPDDFQKCSQSDCFSENGRSFCFVTYQKR